MPPWLTLAEEEDGPGLELEPELELPAFAADRTVKGKGTSDEVDFTKRIFSAWIHSGIKSQAHIILILRASVIICYLQNVLIY